MCPRSRSISTRRLRSRREPVVYHSMTVETPSAACQLLAVAGRPPVRCGDGPFEAATGLTFVTQTAVGALGAEWERMRSYTNL